MFLCYSKIRLPIIDGAGDFDPFDDLDRQISRSVSPISSNIRITKTAIAGIVGDELGNLDVGKAYSELLAIFHYEHIFNVSGASKQICSA